MNEFVREVITGQLRLAVHESTIENISTENKNFINLLYEKITTELQKLGLYLIEISEMTLLDLESKNTIFNSKNIIYENIGRDLDITTKSDNLSSMTSSNTKAGTTSTYQNVITDTKTSRRK